MVTSRIRLPLRFACFRPAGGLFGGPGEFVSLCALHVPPARVLCLVVLVCLCRFMLLVVIYIGVRVDLLHVHRRDGALQPTLNLYSRLRVVIEFGGALGLSLN